MRRILRPGGVLILGTPDYSTASWRVIERLYALLIPGGYADEHITHYTREGLIRMLDDDFGLQYEGEESVAASELVLRLRKPGVGAGD
jgi:hypothetical protein